MKALRIVSGDPPRLEIVDLPKPVPGPRQVLVRIIASGVNRADLLQLKGMYQVPPDAPPDIPGLEFAGIAEVLGSGCSRVREGQRVFGLCGGGAHAEYIVSPEDLLMQTPDVLGDVEAGAVPEAYITAHDALVSQAAMQPGERILIHAIGSGVGLAALQIVRTWGCEAFGTSRSEHKLEAVRRLKLNSIKGEVPAVALNFVGPDAFDEVLRACTNGEGMNIILDPVGATYFERNINVLAERGRLIVIATMGGTTTSLSLSVFMRKRLRLFGTMLRSRSLEEKAAATRAFERDVLAKFESGPLTPIIDRRFPLEQATDAYSYMQSDANFGKIVLTMAAHYHS